MTKPLVSIVLPNYNGSKFLVESIDSVLNQTYENFELIIIDDGSTDNSKEVIDSYKDKRVKAFYLEKNRHVAYAGNYGLTKCNGKYFARIDSDDIWHKDKLMKQVNFMEENSEYSVCFTKVNIIDDNSKIVNEEYQEIFDLFNSELPKTQLEWAKFFFYYGNKLCNASSLTRKEILDKNNIKYNLFCMPGEDFELWAKLNMEAPIYVLEETLTDYRWISGDGKISASPDELSPAFYNVKTLVREHYFDSMSNDKFECFFGDEFIYNGKHTQLEFECEKAFLLMKNIETCENVNFLGLMKIYEILEQNDGLEVLENKFEFSLPDFYKKIKSYIFYEQNLKIKLSIEENEKISEELKRNENHLMNIISNYESSTSWKITKPLRAIRRILIRK